MDKLDRFVAQLPVAVRRGWKDAFRTQRPPAAVVSLEPAICAAIIRAVTELARECGESDRERS